jgi:hypothetical protein
MAPNGLASESPIVIAKRLSDLLLSFPSAAAGGVPWQTLLRKYEERYSTKLDVSALGHSSPLGAATALLWDVLGNVSAKDNDNPMVSIEDSVALTAEPGASATWPSLYQALCKIVCEGGSKEEEDGNELACAILVSQLKPLLQREWHNDFDDASLSYLTEQGKPVRVKKMKHLLQAMLKWREHRLALGRHTELDHALQPRLGLVPSKKHNDLLLRCVLPTPSMICCHDDESECAPIAASETGFEMEIVREIEKLRAENASLQLARNILEQHEQDDMSNRRSLKVPPSQEMVDIWDDPSQPPPFEYCGTSTPSGSIASASDFGMSSGRSTPLPPASGTHSHSVGPASTTWIWDGQSGQVSSMLPMWCLMGDRSLHKTRTGLVQQALTIFEGNKVVPSFFTMGVREFGCDW